MPCNVSIIPPEITSLGGSFIGYLGSSDEFTSRFLDARSVWPSMFRITMSNLAARPRKPVGRDQPNTPATLKARTH